MGTPMSEEAKRKISEAFARKRAERGLDDNGRQIIPTELKNKPVTVRMEDVNFDPKIFEIMKTGKPVDLLLSSKGGMTRATNFMVVGDPGVGKSTVTLDILADLQTAGMKVLFVSGEMDRFDVYDYVQRYPKFGKIDTLFMGEYLDENPKLVVEEMLNAGYDVVLIDSFVEVQDTVKSAVGMSTGEAEKWLVDLMRSHNGANNEEKIYTSFLCIQQVNKGGNFVGSNKLKHNTTGMMEIRFDEDGNRYLEFSKNRRGEVNKKLYFSLKESGDVHYDDIRFNLDESARKVVDAEKTRLKEEDHDWGKAFGEFVTPDGSGEED
jgi:predicted ATP-dependent serine protease